MVAESVIWQAPEKCRGCVWCCPWNGKGYGCAHPTVKGLLEGVVKCGGEHHKEWQPWVMPKIEEI